MGGGARIGSYPSDLTALLMRLDADPQRAGAEYERLRRKLTLFFEVRQCQPLAEELADRTLDVVARRIQEGVEIFLPDISSYSYGVAQNVLRDHRKRFIPEPLLREPAAPSS